MFSQKRSRQEHDLERELNAHLEAEAEDQQQSGMAADAARHAARRALGNLTQIQEETRAQWSWTFLEQLAEDLRHGSRLLIKTPTFTLVAVLALALGIGANTAIFSVINTLLIRPLPYPDSAQIVELWQTIPNNSEAGVAYPDYVDWRREANLFEQLATVFPTQATLSGDGPAERIRIAYATSNYLDIFRLRPIQGHLFRPEDAQRPVAILSYDFWQRRFGADPAALGRSLTIDGRSLTVIGILPPRALAEYRNGDVYAPIEPAVAQYFLNRGSHTFSGTVGRLKPGVTLDQARHQLASISKSLERQYRENAGVGANAAFLRDRLGRRARPLLGLLLAAVTLVLLIACVNVANLLLARSAARRKELTLRAALGASRARLIRQLLTESVLLAVAGGVLGLVIARISFEALTRFVPDANAMGGPALDARVLLFTFALSLATGLLFGIAPAFQVTRRNPAHALRESSRVSAGIESRRLRSGLVVVEIGLAFLLLTGAGLLLRSLDQLTRIDPGFQRERVLTLQLGLPEGPNSAPAESIILRRRILERLEQLPGVTHAGIGTGFAFTGFSSGSTMYVEGTPDPGRGKYPEIRMRAVNPGYFAAMGVPLLRGRLFNDRDGAMPMVSRSQLVDWFRKANLPVVLNQTAAAKFFPNQDPIGRRVRYAPDWGGPWLTVIGVVGDFRDGDLARPPDPTLHLSSDHHPMSDTLVIRTAGDPAAVIPAIQKEVQAVNPDVPITRASTLAELVSGSFDGRRTNMLLIGILAALAFVLATVGVYGVMAYTVAQRTHDIGIRLALGATTRDVLAMVLANGGRLAAGGIALGIAAAAATTRFLASMLYGVAPIDALTFAAAGAALAPVALLASFIPARRATRVDPVQALRCE